jgi:hypothetical protein
VRRPISAIPVRSPLQPGRGWLAGGPAIARRWSLRFYRPLSHVAAAADTSLGFGRRLLFAGRLSAGRPRSGQSLCGRSAGLVACNARYGYRPVSLSRLAWNGLWLNSRLAFRSKSRCLMKTLVWLTTATWLAAADGRPLPPPEASRPMKRLSVWSVVGPGSSRHGGTSVVGRQPVRHEALTSSHASRLT